MGKQRLVEMQAGLERLVSRWWFAVLFVLLFSIPPTTAKPVDPGEIPKLIIAVFSQAVIYAKPALFPLFKVFPVLVVVLLLILKNKAAPWFTMYAAANLLATAIGENIAETAEYGWVVLGANIAMTLPVALSWFWESLARRGDFAQPRFGPAALLFLPLALLAFWFPVDLQTLRPDFKPLYFLTSEAGLTFCQMVPVYLTVLLWYYPRVNLVTMRVTGLVGFIIGLLSLQFIFGGGTVWMGVLHLPLPVISLHALILTGKKALARNLPERSFSG